MAVFKQGVDKKNVSGGSDFHFKGSKNAAPTVNIQNKQDDNIEKKPSGLDKLRSWFAKNLPGTTKTLADLQQNPLSITKSLPNKKMDITSVLLGATNVPNIGNAGKAAFNAIKEPIIDEGQRIKNLAATFKKGTPLSAKAGAGLTAGLGLANVVLSPVSAAFAGAEKIPGLGTAAKLSSLPFNIAGESAAGATGAYIDKIPFLSQQARQNIKPASEEAAALLAQVAVGKLGHSAIKGVEKAPAGIDIKGFEKASVKPKPFPEKATSELRSVGSRLERLSPETKQINKLLNETDTVASIETGKKALELKNLKLEKIQKKNPTELFNVTDALEGRISPEKLTSQGKSLYDFFDKTRKETASLAKEKNLKIKTRYGKDLDFVERKDYIPHQIPDNAELAKGAVRKDVITNLVRTKFAKSPKEAAAQIDKYIEFRDTGGSANRDYFAQKLVDSDQAKTLSEANGKITRFFKASRQQRSSNLEKAREVDLPFYDPNPLRYIPKYIESTQKRLASAGTLGPNFEVADSLLGKIKNPDAQKVARELIKVARGANEPGSVTANRVLQAGRKASTFKLNPLSAITNIGQSANSLLASNPTSFLKGAVKSLTKEGKSNAIESGALSESVLRGVQNAAASEGNLIGKYLKSTGFTASEKMNRTIAANTGIEWAKQMGKRLSKNPNDKFALKELDALEIDPKKILAQKGILQKDDVLRAAKTFTGQTQFLSRATDLPRFFTSSELGKSMMQFKSFSYQQAKFIASKTIGELKTGNPGRFARNLAVLATVYPMTGEVISDIRALLQGKPRTTKGLQRYIEDATQVGAFGILSDIVNAASFSGGVANSLIGPSFSTAAKDLELLVKGVKKDQKLSQSDKRYLTNQIPLGSLFSGRLFPNKD